jgi:hypothetical protein
LGFADNRIKVLKAMKMLYPPKKVSKEPRVKLTEQILKHFHANIFKQNVSALVKESGRPYTLLYNLARGRIKSLSARDYRLIFDEEPPPQEVLKVDGKFFRCMVDLWIFLNDHKTKSNLFLEFYGEKHPKKTDYRIFSGQTKTVDTRLEKMMEKKFADSGTDKSILKKWIREFSLLKRAERIPYKVIRPDLLFLRNALGINPTRVLNQSFDRYESGELKSVPKNVYDKTLIFKKSAAKALNSGLRFEVEKFMEEVYGIKEGFTLYSEVSGELWFLQKYARKSPRKYLGRSPSAYERGRLKRIASWRAQKIRDDCDASIMQRPDFPILSLPKSYQKMWLNKLLAVLVSYREVLLFEHEDIAFEKRILTPLHYSNEYKKRKHGFTQVDKASYTLGMRKKAFDLMVAKHCDIFRSVGTYSNKWYLSDLYLKELTEKKFFDLITVKYELMAKYESRFKRIDACMN